MLDVFFYYPIFIPEIILWDRGEAVVKFKRGALAPCWETVFKFRNMLENSVIMIEKLSMLEECWEKSIST
jgi:hypothetical protein